METVESFYRYVYNFYHDGDNRDFILMNFEILCYISNDLINVGDSLETGFEISERERKSFQKDLL